MKFDDHKCIFFHVPKNAGSSIEKWFCGGLPNPAKANWEMWFGLDPARNMYLQHATAKFMQDEMEKRIFDSYYKFAIVRNPFDRVRSAYDYDPEKKRGLSFDTFVTKLPAEIEADRNKWGAHCLPQHRYTHVNGIQVCNSVFRYEDLKTCQTELQERFGLEGEMPRENVTRDRSNPEFTPVIVKAIVDAYQKDFELFGYPTNPS